MNVDTESKLLFKFGRLERTVYVDYSPKNVTVISDKFKVWYYMYVHALTH